MSLNASVSAATSRSGVQQEMEGAQHRGEADQKDGDLRERHRHRDRHGREDEQEERQRQHRRIAHEQAPVQRRELPPIGWRTDPRAAWCVDRHRMPIVAHGLGAPPP
jgi:hypothetical protein